MSLIINLIILFYYFFSWLLWKCLYNIQTTNFNKLADKNRFLVCYSQDLIDEENSAFWEVVYNFHEDHDVDDVKFITKLIEKHQT